MIFLTRLILALIALGSLLGLAGLVGHVEAMLCALVFAVCLAGEGIIHLLDCRAVAASKQASAAAAERLALLTELRTLNENSRFIFSQLADAREAAEKFHGKALVFLHNLDTQSEHANKLLQWIGETAQAREGELVGV